MGGKSPWTTSQVKQTFCHQSHEAPGDWRSAQQHDLKTSWRARGKRASPPALAADRGGGQFPGGNRFLFRAGSCRRRGLAHGSLPRESGSSQVAGSHAQAGWHQRGTSVASAWHASVTAACCERWQERAESDHTHARAAPVRQRVRWRCWRRTLGTHSSAVHSRGHAAVLAPRPTAPSPSSTARATARLGVAGGSWQSDDGYLGILLLATQAPEYLLSGEPSAKNAGRSTPTGRRQRQQ